MGQFSVKILAPEGQFSVALNKLTKQIMSYGRPSTFPTSRGAPFVR